jgi:hypothetical protein
LLQPARRGTWLVQSLVLRKRLIGYVVFEAGPLDGRIYASLRDSLSAAIGGLARGAAEAGPFLTLEPLEAKP